jgi:alpha-tubulin suppressor-like RCC1 family protein
MKVFVHLDNTLRLLALAVPLTVLVACGGGGGGGGGGSGGGNSSAALTPKSDAQYVKICNNGEQEDTGSCPAKPALGTQPTDWACTLDSVSGLIWEVKTPWQLNPAQDDFRNSAYTYTNYDDTQSPQLWVPGPGGVNGAYQNPKQVDLDAATNALGFVNKVNGLTGLTPLCGSTLWRRPTQAELESLVDLTVSSVPATSTSFAIANAAINYNRFPNTNPSEPYVVSTPTTDRAYDPVLITNNITFQTFNKTMAEQLKPWPRGGNYRAPLRLVSAQPAKAAVGTGVNHTCALKTNGAVYCWGANTDGQIGSGTLNSIYNTPILVALPADSTAIAVGTGHSCALQSTGNIMCWGNGVSGQLGNGSTASSIVPVSLTVPGGVKAITAGGSHTCAIKTNDEVVCWGNNAQGQLGDGTNTNATAPVTVGITGGVTAISAGGNHTCALKTNGDIACWGDNTYGQFGNGSTTSSNTPVVLSLAGGAIAVSAGSTRHVCAIKTSGDAVCWGDGTFGQLGNGATANSLVPVATNTVAGGLKEIATGSLHTCAIKTNGDATCWGGNGFGALGNGTNTNSSVPVAVTLPGGVKAISKGVGQHSCAIKTDGSTVCWGGSNNYAGQLGNGTNGPSNLPVPVIY